MYLVDWLFLLRTALHSKYKTKTSQKGTTEYKLKILYFHTFDNTLPCLFEQGTHIFILYWAL